MRFYGERETRPGRRQSESNQQKEKQEAVREIDKDYKKLDGILDNFYEERSRNNPKLDRIRLNAISQALEIYKKALKLLKQHGINLHDLEKLSWTLHVKIRSGHLRTELDPDGTSDLPKGSRRDRIMRK